MPHSVNARSDTFARAAEVALWLLAMGGPLALGGAAEFWVWALAALSLLSLALLCAFGRRMYLAVPTLFWAPAVGAALCAVQLVPLPPALLKWLSPRAAELRDSALLPLGFTSWRPISLDVPGTWREWTKYVAYACLMLAASRLAVRRQVRVRLLSVVALSGVAIAALGIAHQLEHAKLLTRFGNPNHLASFLTLTSILCLGLAAEPAHHRHRWMWELGFVVSSLGVLFSFSRGGIFFFLLSAVLFIALDFKRRKPRLKWREPKRWAALGFLGVGLAVGAAVAFERLWMELGSVASLQGLRESKLELWKPFAQAALEYWKAGMGRGAFALGFAREQAVLGDYTFYYPESWPLQLLAEFGAPGAALFVGTCVWGIRRLFRNGVRSSLELAAVCGLLGMVLHDLLDFSLELPACAGAAWLTLGSLCGSRVKLEEAAMLVRTRAIFAGVVATSLGIALAWAPGHLTLAKSEAQLQQALLSGAKAEDVRAPALPLIAKHPADHFLYTLVAEAYARKGENAGQALAFVNLALFARPIDVDAHRIAGRALLLMDHPLQAMLEYRLAYSGVNKSAALEEGARSASTVEQLATLCPEESAAMLELTQKLWKWGRQKQAIEFLRFELDALPQLASQQPLWTELAHMQAEHDPAQALSTLDQAAQKGFTNVNAELLRARILWDTGERQKCLARLQELARDYPENVDVAFGLAQRLSASGDGAHALEVLQNASASVPPERRADFLSTEAEVFEQLQRPSKAAEYLETATRLRPDSPGLRYALAQAYLRMGNLQEASSALREGMRLDSADGALGAEKAFQQLTQEVTRPTP